VPLKQTLLVDAAAARWRLAGPGSAAGCRRPDRRSRIAVGSAYGSVVGDDRGPTANPFVLVFKVALVEVTNGLSPSAPLREVKVRVEPVARLNVPFKATDRMVFWCSSFSYVLLVTFKESLSFKDEFNNQAESL